MDDHGEEPMDQQNQWLSRSFLPASSQVKQRKKCESVQKKKQDPVLTMQTQRRNANM